MNKRSPIARKFRSFFQELYGHGKVDEAEDPRTRQARTWAEDIIMEEIWTVSRDHPDWYENRLFRLYLVYGSYRAIESATRIPYASCQKAVQRYMNKLKEKAIHYPRNFELCKFPRGYPNLELCQKK